ncbi:MAG: hypothetical protein Q8R69_05970 [Telluria sp.]|nr:hypothetical protein [Telluria sp.]
MAMLGRYLLCALIAGVAAPAPAFDFTSAHGFAATCARQGAAAPGDDDGRIAFVICRDTALLRQVVSWGAGVMERLPEQMLDDATLMQEFATEIDYVRAELAVTRKVLAQVRLGTRASLRLVPAQWQIDLNGDGQVALWEKYMFAIPKRAERPFRLDLPSSNQEYYEREYQLDAAIRVDQSDVLWALSYHRFLEAALANLRAFDLHPGGQGIVLARPALLKLAHRFIQAGLGLSGQMRKSVLAERDDNEEWIANPQQASSVFPLALDGNDFVTWGEILTQLDALLQGRTLLPATEGGGGVLGQFAPLCRAGSALNVAKAYLKPPPAGTIFSFRQGARLSPMHCQAVDARHPLSRLPELIEQARKSDAGMRFLRYLYWIN